MGMSTRVINSLARSRERKPSTSMNSVLTDRQGNEWFCKIVKDDFDKLKDDYHVEVRDAANSRSSKKFLKSYLTFVRPFEEQVETTNSNNKQQDSL